ncbi:GTP-binding protein YPTM1 [Orchesella cincta]|uniref:GTP-binding protein YPTM1 n=1 Tax=Orchesella cincta TaxID=48709 RepID=A0A1D2MB91_ORCCI|nr:GTP-binding protein YPTM1 [Orchesella cincta]
MDRSEDNICPICFSSEQASSEDYFVTTACGHIYHQECILHLVKRETVRCHCSAEITEDNLRHLYGGMTETPSTSTSSPINTFGVAIQNELQKIPLMDTTFKVLGVSTEHETRQSPIIDYTFKVILLGETGVGKTCVLCRFSDNSFSERHISTVGADMRFKSVTIGRSTVQLSIWDTGGQERFHSINAGYLRGVHGIIFVYDITNQESFNRLDYWTAFAKKYGPEDCVRIMIGNKCDQAVDREVNTDNARVTESENMPFFETSARDDINCEAAFRSVAAAILQNEQILASVVRERDNILRVWGDPDSTKEKKCYVPSKIPILSVLPIRHMQDLQD